MDINSDKELDKQIKLNELLLQIQKEKTKQEEEKTRREIEKLKLKSELDIKKLEKQYELKQRNITDLTNKINKIENIIHFCYVITNEIYAKNNMYKFGRTRCSPEELIQTYSRGLPDPKIMCLYRTDNPVEDETHVLNHFKEYRVDGPNKKSEWLKIEFNILLDYLNNYFERDIVNINNLYYKLYYNEKLLFDIPEIIIALDYQTKLLSIESIKKLYEEVQNFEDLMIKIIRYNYNNEKFPELRIIIYDRESSNLYQLESGSFVLARTSLTQSRIKCGLVRIYTKIVENIEEPKNDNILINKYNTILKVNIKKYLTEIEELSFMNCIEKALDPNNKLLMNDYLNN